MAENWSKQEYMFAAAAMVHLAHRTFRNWSMTPSLFSPTVKAMRWMLLPLACLVGVTMTAISSPEAGCCPVLELRQYTLKPGQREVLINLFDRHFVESQEAVGMTLVGQFRDRRRADRFVWLRGFSNMERRHTALAQTHYESFDGRVGGASLEMVPLNFVVGALERDVVAEKAPKPLVFHLRNIVLHALTKQKCRDGGVTPAS